MTGQQSKQADGFVLTVVCQSSGSPEVKGERRRGALIKIRHISLEWESILKFKKKLLVRAKYVVHVAQKQSESFLRGTQRFFF